MLGACEALAVTFYYSGDFETGRQHALSGIEIWRSTSARPFTHELVVPAVGCLMWWALCAWHTGEIAASKTTMTESIAVAKELNDMAGLGMALYCSGLLAHFEGNSAEAERVASDLIELCTRQAFASWLPAGVILRGWARSVSGNTVEGVSCIEEGIRDYQATGAMLRLPYFLAVKAEALHLAGRNPEALETIRAAEVLAERSEVRWWCAEMHRLRGVFLAASGADEVQVEASFSEAIRIAKAQKSVSLEQRVEGTYAEYRRQKAGAAGEGGFRPSLL
jgi:predicted ATPase